MTNTLMVIWQQGCGMCCPSCDVMCAGIAELTRTRRGALYVCTTLAAGDLVNDQHPEVTYQLIMCGLQCTE